MSFCFQNDPIDSVLTTDRPLIQSQTALSVTTSKMSLLSYDLESLCDVLREGKQADRRSLGTAMQVISCSLKDSKLMK